MYQLGNLTAAYLGQRITIPPLAGGIPERSGVLLSVEHHYGDGYRFIPAALTTVVCRTDAPEPEVWTNLPHTTCTVTEV